MRRLLAVVSSALLVIGCGTASGPAASARPASTPSRSATAATSASPSGGILPILVSSEITKGTNRFLFTLTDTGNALVSAPDVAVRLAFYDVARGADTVAFETDSRFIWAIEGHRGLYAASVTFPTAGRWGTRFTATFPGGRTATIRADYDVAEAGTTPPIGGPAPSVETPTAAIAADVKRVATDPKPDPRFYTTSVAQALAAHQPFVVAFATPLFCKTAVCGPALENVKQVAPEFPAITFINVEPYQLRFDGTTLQPVLDAAGELQLVPASVAYGLPSEPFIFLVDASGSVRAKFEGVASLDELREALGTL